MTILVLLYYIYIIMTYFKLLLTISMCLDVHAYHRTIIKIEKKKLKMYVA